MTIGSRPDVEAGQGHPAAGSRLEDLADVLSLRGSAFALRP